MRCEHGKKHVRGNAAAVEPRAQPDPATDERGYRKMGPSQKDGIDRDSF